ncbi:MAG: HGGxSTG domain-containing protein [Proteobacteria bacterium]|nr:HGGxSTG domain-containing protein [Pseudomonadota bacterium]
MKPTFTQFREPRILVFGRHSCNQCTAKSKRGGMRCRAPSVKGKSVCRMHGGKSTGPRTEEGLLRLGRARLIYGTQTRRVRLEHKKAMLAIRALEESALFYGIPWGPRIAGRKPS